MKQILEEGNAHNITVGNRPTIRIPLIQLEQFSSIFHNEPYLVDIKIDKNDDYKSGLTEFVFVYKDLTKEESWKTYSIMDDSNNKIGVLIRHSIWDKAEDSNELSQNKQRLNLDKMPKIKSTNVYCSSESVAWNEYQSSLLRGIELIQNAKLIRSDDQKYFLDKQIAISSCGVKRSVDWEHPHCCFDLEEWIKHMVILLEEMIKSKKCKIEEIFLDYMCSIETYMSYIIGRK